MKFVLNNNVNAKLHLKIVMEEMNNYLSNIGVYIVFKMKRNYSTFCSHFSTESRKCSKPAVITEAMFMRR